MYLQNLAQLIFVKLARNDLQNLAKHCKTLISKIAKVELQCKTITQITKHCK